MSGHLSHIARHAGGRTNDTRGIFVQEGEYWTIAHASRVFRLRDAKGLHYLAHLLRRPGEIISAVELFEEVGRQHARAGSSADHSEVERARSAVSKRIRSALDKIREHDPILGRYLSACIKTGHECAYVPDPERPIEWQLSHGEDALATGEKPR